MSFLATPILSASKILISYTDINHAHGLFSRNVDFSLIPRSLTIPVKNTTDPKSEYHTWLETFGSDPDINFLEERRQLVKQTKMPTTTNSTLTKEEQPYLKASKMNKSTARRQRVVSDDVTEEEIKKLVNEADEADEADEAEPIVRVRDGNFIGTDSETDWSDDVRTPPIVSKAHDQTDLSVTINSQQQADYVFRILPNLQWRDRDEFKMTASAINNISMNDLIRIFPVMNQLADDLDRAVSASTGALESLTPDEKRNFLFHVIAKGETMYYQSIADPDFCLYMLDQYQPLYTMMKKKVDIHGKTWYRAD
jgi:hypothetical protein